jgi:ComF family protein
MLEYYIKKIPSIFFSDFIQLFAPKICPLCSSLLHEKSYSICFVCSNNLPFTELHLQPYNNNLVKIFWGRVHIEAAASFLFFQKGLKAQKILHLLKYKNKPEIGTEIGRKYGDILKNTRPFNTADLIIPVPLHKKKLKKRGYNQSEMFAKGLSESMNIPIDTHSLQRIEFTETQTKKSRLLRWENVKEKFSLSHSEQIANKHVVIVDDVITTGATIESCIQELSKAENVKISIIAIACAVQ